jgi:hypothetical protein
MYVATGLAVVAAGAYRLGVPAGSPSFNSSRAGGHDAITNQPARRLLTIVGAVAAIAIGFTAIRARRHGPRRRRR